ncbi:MAG: T9SS type A sorting domain-containing protein [Bacteroidales bacterium]|nr:T9SS type A sorting domain-containing protein [Bacteroidales bacterium]
MASTDKSFKKLVLILFLIALLPHLASGTRKYVPDDYPTIQEAINSINAVDSVIVRPGFYQENLVITNKVVKLFSEYIFTNDTAVISQTIIDGNQANTAIYINNNNFQLCVINGFTIQNGRSDWGGGIMCWENSTVRIENCHVRNNFSTGYGGGIATAGNSQVNIENCEIMNNSATNEGGGVEVGNFSRVSISDCIISGNYGQYGGGIYNCTIPLASEYKFGLAVNRCIFTNNSAYAGGGFANAWVPNEAKIVNSTFYNNQASNSPEIFIWGGNSIWVINTIIYNDSALVRDVMGIGAYGGLMRFDYSLIYGGESTIIHNDTSALLIYSETNIDTIPCFVDSSNGDFHLESLSPCIDAAIDFWYIPALEVQPGEIFFFRIGDVLEVAPEGSILAGDTLVYIPPDEYYGSMPDMGAFEYYPPISVKEFQVHERLFIYPNPVRNKLNIKLPADSKKSQLSLIDLEGHLLFEENINVNEPIITLDVSGLSSGFYFLKRGDEVYKIVKY